MKKTNQTKSYDATRVLLIFMTVILSVSFLTQMVSAQSSIMSIGINPSTGAQVNAEFSNGGVKSIIPLTEIRERTGLKYAFGLSYTSNFNEDNLPSWTGMGWSLNPPAVYKSQGKYYAVWDGMISGEIKDGYVKGKPTIKFTIHPGYIEAINGKGVKFYFERTASATTECTYLDHRYTCEGDGQHYHDPKPTSSSETYIYALTRMVDMDGITIYFEYDVVTQVEGTRTDGEDWNDPMRKDGDCCRYNLWWCRADWEYDDTDVGYRHTKYYLKLKRIYDDIGDEIIFNTSLRADVPSYSQDMGDFKLDRITAKTDGVIGTEFVFTYDYSNNGQLTLRELRQIGRNNVSYLPYIFNYTDKILTYISNPSFSDVSLEYQDMVIDGVNYGKRLQYNTMSNGMGTSIRTEYEYGAPRIRDGKIFHPFIIKRTDAATGQVTTNYETNGTFAGNILSIDVESGIIGTPEESRMINFWREFPGIGGNITKVGKEVKIDRRGNMVEVEYYYNQKGFVKNMSEVVNGDYSTEKITEVIYADDVNSDFANGSMFGIVDEIRIYSKSDGITLSYMKNHFDEDLRPIRNCNWVDSLKDNGSGEMYFDSLVQEDEMVCAENWDFDQWGREIKHKTPDGSIRQIEYGADNDYQYVTKEWSTEFGSRYSPEKETQYNMWGEIISETTYYGDTSYFFHDNKGRISKVVGPEDTISSPLKEYIYDDDQIPITVTTKTKVDEGAYIEETVFIDGFGDIMKKVVENGPNDIVVEKEYYPNGKVKKIYDPHYQIAGPGDYVEYTYEPGSKKRLLSVRYQDGSTINYAYDDISRSITTTYPDGTTTVHLVDIDDTIIRSVQQDETFAEYVNEKGILKEIRDPNENLLYTFEHDSIGRILSYNNSNAGVRNFAYGKGGKLIWTGDSEGNTKNWIYDDRGRVERIESSDGNYVDYYHDEYPRGVNAPSNLDYSYGKITWTETPDITTYYFYDLMGRIGQIDYEIDGKEYTQKFEYNSNSQIKRQEYPNGLIVEYNYNHLGQQVGVVVDGLETDLPNDELGHFYFDADNKILNVNYANGEFVTLRYDSRNRIIEMEGPFERHYQYDIMGNMIREYDDYKDYFLVDHDDLNRITEVEGIFNATYAYDPSGNRMSMNDENYDYFAGTNKLKSAGIFDFEYDDNGNIVTKENTENGELTRYYYDSDNRLSKVKLPNNNVEKYKYREDGLRIKKENNNEWVIFHYDVLKNLIYEEKCMKYELANGIDDDCDGIIDENIPKAVVAPNASVANETELVQGISLKTLKVMNTPIIFGETVFNIEVKNSGDSLDSTNIFVDFGNGEAFSKDLEIKAGDFVTLFVSTTYYDVGAYDLMVSLNDENSTITVEVGGVEELAQRLDDFNKTLSNTMDIEVVDVNITHMGLLGSTIYLSAAVRNNGESDADNMLMKVYINANTVWDNSDALVSIAPGETEVFNVEVPLEKERFYIVFDANSNGNVWETDRTNNHVEELVDIS